MAGEPCIARVPGTPGASNHNAYIFILLNTELPAVSMSAGDTGDGNIVITDIRKESKDVIYITDKDNLASLTIDDILNEIIEKLETAPRTARMIAVSAKE